MTTVLIADDERGIRDRLAGTLANAGYGVIQAEDGGTALAKACNERPDVILLDVMMPVMDGFEVLRRLKAGASERDIPVIMLTALKREQDVVGGLQLGAADYLAKPFIPDELVQRIRRLLTTAQMEQGHVLSRRPG